jgi:hypothetical protein
MLSYGFDGPRPAVGFAQHLYVGLALKKAANLTARRALVVNDHHAYL